MIGGLLLNCIMKSLPIGAILKLLVILIDCHLILSMRTSPPDEVIEILRSGDYNKHHLPTYVGANGTAKNKKTLTSIDGWTLIVEHYQKIDYDRIRLIQKEQASNRETIIEMNKAVAKEIASHIYNSIEYYYRGSNSANKTSAELYDDDLPEDLEVSTEIRIDPSKVYQIDSFTKSGKIAALHIAEARSNSRRTTVMIPVLHWRNVSDILMEFVETKFDEYRGPPTRVVIGMYIESMSSFRAETMDFHVDIYFAENWQDPRLSHSSEYPVLLRDMALFEDLYFANAKDAKYHNVTSPNFLLYIYPNGTIYLDIRISLVLNCMMYLSHYPLDQQECFIRILSYAYDKDNLDITWKPVDNITRYDKIKFTDMDLVNWNATYCNGSYDIGVWACALANFKMKREIMHHILQSYIPTALIVIISWFSFWLDVSAVPGRVSLCITTLLTLATQAQAAKMSLPQVSYAKAIDIWMGICMGFVFGVMIEFTVVNYVSRRTSSKPIANAAMLAGATAAILTASTRSRIKATVRQQHSENNGTSFDNAGNEQAQCNCETLGNAMCQKHSIDLNGSSRNSTLQKQLDQKIPTKEQQIYQQQAHRNRKLAIQVDKICRITFPCSFLLFNLVYWPYYLIPRGV